jgi:phage tail sheath protein FI
MGQYLSPGVYVEEVPSSLKPIVGVGTSTAGFVGFGPPVVEIPEPNPAYDPTKPDSQDNKAYTVVMFPPYADKKAAEAAVAKARDASATADKDAKTASDASTQNPDNKDAKSKARDAADKAADARAAAIKANEDHLATLRAAAPGEARLCTSFAEFKKLFGGFSSNPDQNKLVHGVYGFFNNGGTRCYVMRYGTEGELEDPEAMVPFEAVDEIAIVAAPGITNPVIRENIVDHCENMGDRFAILDSAEEIENDELTLENVKKAGEGADAKEVGNSNYAALYFPWIQVFDTPTKLMHSAPTDPLHDGLIYVGPSGHIAGVYAHVDNTRGVHKAPANEAIKGALGLKYPISKPLQDGLNPAGVNCIREFGGNRVIWGARTIGGDANMDFKYISVRRLFLYLRESIDEGTQWVVFEPNDRTLWAKITRNVSAFLRTVWMDGALFGSTPEEAFYVKCDDETNPPEIRELGRVVTEIGVAVVKPAEFVIFRISQWAGPQAGK